MGDGNDGFGGDGRYNDDRRSMSDKRPFLHHNSAPTHFPAPFSFLREL
jgi:hypothetical protein